MQNMLLFSWSRPMFPLNSTSEWRSEELNSSTTSSASFNLKLWEASRKENFCSIPENTANTAMRLARRAGAVLKQSRWKKPRMAMFQLIKSRNWRAIRYSSWKFEGQLSRKQEDTSFTSPLKHDVGFPREQRIRWFQRSPIAFFVQTPKIRCRIVL